MAAPFTQQLRCILVQGLKTDLVDKERLITPLLFAITTLLLFNFVFDEPPPPLAAKFFVAEVFLTLLFALQTSYSRIFGPDQQDRVFELLQSYPLHSGAWFLGKYVLSLIVSGLILVPTLLITGLFHSAALATPFLAQGSLWAIAFLSLAGLAALGILLSTLTLKASGREVLFPILYFPLAIPVLLAASQASLALIQQGENSESWQWLGLLLGFDIIYFTLGLLLFGEIVEST